MNLVSKCSSYHAEHVDANSHYFLKTEFLKAEFSDRIPGENNRRQKAYASGFGRRAPAENPGATRQYANAPQ